MARKGGFLKGIVDLKDLDKVLKVNATSKILKFWTLFINKKEDEEEIGRAHV